MASIEVSAAGATSQEVRPNRNVAHTTVSGAFKNRRASCRIESRCVEIL